MNSEQGKSTIRAAVMAAFGGLAGIAIYVKWTTPEQVTAFLNSQLGVAIVGIIVTWLFSYLNKTAPNLVAIVDALPNVSGVVTKATPEGKALAAAVPSATVVSAGTSAANDLAKGNV